MFKQILIPIDGSPASMRVARAGVAFAKDSGARVTAYHCKDRLPRPIYGDGYYTNRQLTPEFERHANAAAKKCLGAVTRAARDAGVQCETLADRAASPYEGIIEAAAKRRCDLIFIGTHGYRGLTRLAMGSVAEKVARLAKVPVMVYRRSA